MKDAHLIAEVITMLKVFETLKGSVALLDAIEHIAGQSPAYDVDDPRVASVRALTSAVVAAAHKAGGRVTKD